MKLAIITYATRHLKTAQVALNLASRHAGVPTFFALPFRPRKARDVLFEHRPDQSGGPATDDLARFLGAPFVPVDGPEQISLDYDYYLIAGAGLLPPEFVAATAGRVINAHPGVIPLSRGLDSFKWSIIDQMPLGNSLHFIDAEADAGEVISVVPTPVFKTDTLPGLAARHYELEIHMLSSFQEQLKRHRPAIDMKQKRPARMRMPAETERRLPSAFEEYKAKWAV